MGRGNGQSMRALILGGGVIGTSIAYRLASRGADVTVIERSAIACAASGKSGGFLAMDWCDGTPLMHLARRSFRSRHGVSWRSTWGSSCNVCCRGPSGQRRVAMLTTQLPTDERITTAHQAKLAYVYVEPVRSRGAE